MRAKQVVIVAALVIGLTVAVPISIASGTTPGQKVSYPLLAIVADVILLGPPALFYWQGRHVATFLIAPVIGVGAVLLLVTVYIAPGALVLAVAGAVSWVREPGDAVRDR